MMKVLVLYYSYEGNTKLIADRIASELKADRLRLHPVIERENKGFSKYIWGGAQVLMRQKPDLQPLDKNPDDYDILFVGTPVWAWTYCPAIRSVFENGTLSGKKIYFFCTHEGGLRGVIDKCVRLVEKNNQLLGIKDFMNVKTHPEEQLESASQWVKSLVNKGQIILNQENRGK
jgi:flavodoxin